MDHHLSGPKPFALSALPSMKKGLIWLIAVPATLSAQNVAGLRALAHDYYEWRDSSYPVAASDQGKHVRDAKLTDYRMSAVRQRRQHVESLLARVKAIRTDGWSKDDKIDKLLFQSQLEGAAFFPRVMKPEESDPGVYVGESSGAVFSLIKKEYAPKSVRAMAAGFIVLVQLNYAIAPPIPGLSKLTA